MSFLLDTNFVINYLRHAGLWAERMLKIVRQGPVFLSVITYAELIYGTHRASNRTKESQELSDFIAEFSAEILPVTSEVAQRYADARYHLELKGEKLDHLDLLIGSTAVVHSCVLVTDDIKHFGRFPKLVMYEERR